MKFLFLLRFVFLVSLSLASWSSQATLFRSLCRLLFGENSTLPTPPASGRQKLSHPILDPQVFAATHQQEAKWTDASGVRIYRRITPTEYIITEYPQKSSTYFEFSANIDKKGNFGFFVKTREKRKRSKYLYAAKELQAALKHFGAKAQVFQGHWFAWSDNYKQFQKVLKSGGSEEEAAFSTWTGQQAKKRGFTRIKSIKVIEGQGNLNDVKVEFIRPTGR